MDVETLRTKYEALAPVLNEHTRRLWAAAEAEAVGRGGIAMVARAIGMSRTRIARGIEELRSDDRLEPGRTRRAGGGRKRVVDTDPTLVWDLNALQEPITAGDPDDSPLRWTSKSVSKLVPVREVPYCERWGSTRACVAPTASVTGQELVGDSLEMTGLSTLLVAHDTRYVDSCRR